MKKAIVFILGLIFIVSLVSPVTAQTVKSKSAIKGNITVWGDEANQTIVAPPFKAINAAFMKEYPNVKVKYSIGETDTTLQVAISANSLPDCFFLGGNKNPQMAQLAKAGKILPLDGHIDNMSMYKDPNIAGYCNVNGKMYVCPTGFMDSHLVYYNKAIFSKQGLSIPKTWNDFVALCDKVKASGIQPIAFPGATAWENSWSCFALLGDFASDALNKIQHGTGTWMDPTIEKGFDNARLLAQNGYYGSNYSGMNQSDAQLLFTSGKAAMYIDGTWENNVYSKSGLDLGRFYIPNDKGVRVANLSVSNWMTYAISAKTKYPDAAYAYVNYLAQLPAQQIMENTTAIPIMIKGIKPANAMVKQLSDFDILGAQMNQTATACASAKHNTSDLLINVIVPDLNNLKITGHQACQMLDEQSTYPKPSK